MSHRMPPPGWGGQGQPSQGVPALMAGCKACTQSCCFSPSCCASQHLPHLRLSPVLQYLSPGRASLPGQLLDASSGEDAFPSSCISHTTPATTVHRLLRRMGNSVHGCLRVHSQASHGQGTLLLSRKAAVVNTPSTHTGPIMACKGESFKTNISAVGYTASSSGKASPRALQSTVRYLSRAQKH